MKDFKTYKEQVIKYFTEDKRVKYLMLVQALKAVTMILASFPSEICMYFVNEELRGRLSLVGLLLYLGAVILIVCGWFDRLFAWWFKMPILKQHWRHCSLISWTVAMDFYFACKGTWLMMIPGFILFFFCFNADYQRLKKEERKQ